MFKRLAISSVAIATVCAMGLAGCSSAPAQNTNTNTNQAAQVKVEDKLPEFGVASDSTVAVAFENATGKDIVGMQLKDAAGNMGENVFAATDNFANGTKANVNFDKAAAATVEGAASNGMAVTQYPELNVTFADGSTITLHQVNFSDMKDCKIALEGDFGYLMYTSVKDGSAVSTLDAEKSVAEMLAAEAAAQAAAAQAPVYTAPAAGYDFGSAGAGAGAGAAAGSGAAAGGAGDAGCADGILLRR